VRGSKDQRMKGARSEGSKDQRMKGARDKKAVEGI